MAKVTGFTISLTLVELDAVYFALGRMAMRDYDSSIIGEAGHRVYEELTPLINDDG